MYMNFNWDIFFTLLKKKLIVPVIGNDIILIKTGKDISLTLTEHITNQLAKHLKLDFNNLSLRQFISKHQNTTMVKSLVKHVYKEIDIDNIDFSPLRKLAKITDFDTFLTLNFDGFFDDALISTRKNQTIQTVNMSLNSQANNIVKGIEDAIIFNIFGSIKSNTGYAKTGNDFLEYTFSLSKNNYQNKLLKEKTADKSFLFLGNDLPDWIMPTFIRSITNEAFENAENIKFIVENEKDTMTSYSNFINNFQIEYYRSQNNYKSNALSFIDELYEKWMQFNFKQTPNMYNKSVFINAAPENIKELTELYNVLKHRGIDVYYNLKIHENPYLFSREIENQIQRSTVFVTLISKESLNAEKDFAFNKELDIAKTRYSWFHDAEDDSFIEAYILDETKKENKKIPHFLQTLNIENFNTTEVAKKIELKLNSS